MVFIAPLLDVKHLNGQFEASTVCGRQVNRWQRDSKTKRSLCNLLAKATWWIKCNYNYKLLQLGVTLKKKRKLTTLAALWSVEIFHIKEMLRIIISRVWHRLPQKLVISCALCSVCAKPWKLQRKWEIHNSSLFYSFVAPWPSSSCKCVVIICANSNQWNCNSPNVQLSSHSAKRNFNRCKPWNYCCSFRFKQTNFFCWRSII